MAPYGVRHAFSRLSLPVVQNQWPDRAYFSDSTHELCWCSWYLSGLDVCNTSTFEFSMPTLTYSPVGQQPSVKICHE